MARVPLGHDRLRRLVEDQAVPLFLRVGSVNAVCETLNAALVDSGIAESIYPNRIHTLLSEEYGRSLNELTVQLIERAFAALEGNAVDEQPGRAPGLTQSRATILARWQSSRRTNTVV